VEHFAAVRAKLEPDGLFCQWLPLHQLDSATLAGIVASYLEVFPQAQALLASNSLHTPVLGLIGLREPRPWSVATVRRRVQQAAGPLQLDAFGLHDEWAVLGSIVAGHEALAALAAGAPLNTDDRPVVARLAPRATYAPEGTPADRLLALLARLPLDPQRVIDDAEEPGSVARLAAYDRARRAYLQAGVGVVPSADVQRILAQVQKPLLALLRTSPDFRPAYDPLLAMAGALAAREPAAAAQLLGELAQLQPQRPEAAQLLQRLDAAARR
jgi:spermidine synthase